MKPAKPAVDACRGMVFAIQVVATVTRIAVINPMNGARMMNSTGFVHPARMSAESGVRDSRAAIAAHQGVRRAGGNAKNQGDEVPGDGAE